MLFSVMHLIESEAKIGKTFNVPTSSAGAKKKSGGRSGAAKKEQEKRAEAAESAALRESCASAMLCAAVSMSNHRSRMWKRGVPDEDVVGIPCRIAYQMLESATGVLARKASSADAALGMIAATVDSADCLLSTVVAALVDLLHSYEHIASMVAELCCLVSQKPTNRLAIELIREVGRLDTSGAADTAGKASGIKNVAPFISELATCRPHIVLANISLVLPHLDSEPYQLRSAIVTAIGNLALGLDRSGSESESMCPREAKKEEMGEENVSVNRDMPPNGNLTKSRNALLDILCTRAQDRSSHTRSAVLKTWASITEADALPLERVLPVTTLAIGRLQDKAVMVRRSAMQVSILQLKATFSHFLNFECPRCYSRI